MNKGRHQQISLCIISDTHGPLGNFYLPEADILLHCGDIGTAPTADRLPILLQELAIAGNYQHRVVISGNHDFLLWNAKDPHELMPTGLTFLAGETVEIMGLKIHGNGACPHRRGGAFEYPPRAMARQWRKVPPDTDILMTHIPPRGLLDNWTRPEGLSEHEGCPHLTANLARIRPTLLACGHIHGAHGNISTRYAEHTTTIINASTHGNGRISSGNRLKNPATLVKMEKQNGEWKIVEISRPTRLHMQLSTPAYSAQRRRGGESNLAQTA